MVYGCLFGVVLDNFLKGCYDFIIKLIWKFPLFSVLCSRLSSIGINSFLKSFFNTLASKWTKLIIMPVLGLFWWLR